MYENSELNLKFLQWELMGVYDYSIVRDRRLFVNKYRFVNRSQFNPLARQWYFYHLKEEERRSLQDSPHSTDYFSDASSSSSSSRKLTLHEAVKLQEVR